MHGSLIRGGAALQLQVLLRSAMSSKVRQLLNIYLAGPGSITFAGQLDDYEAVPDATKFLRPAPLLIHGLG
jgi:hypothetical protein